jgi:hypothetical protein
MNTPLTVECDIHIERRGRGARKELEPTRPPPLAPTGRVPRVAKLMALAIRFDGLLHSGAVTSYAALARLGHVTIARVSQVMSLLYLAPDIQEAVLFLPRVERGRDSIILRDLLPVAAELDWRKQRSTWRQRMRSVHMSQAECGDAEAPRN